LGKDPDLSNKYRCNQQGNLYPHRAQSQHSGVERLQNSERKAQINVVFFAGCS
jgi:hypothetical protein